MWMNKAATALAPIYLRRNVDEIAFTVGAGGDVHAFGSTSSIKQAQPPNSNSSTITDPDCTKSLNSESLNVSVKSMQILVLN